MISENENPTNEQSNATDKPNNTTPPVSKEDSMSILERRLAEINARKGGNANPVPSAPASQPAPPAAPAQPENKPAQPTTQATEIKIEPTEPPAQPAREVSASAPETTKTPDPAVTLSPASPPADPVASSPTKDHGPDSGDVFSGAVAFHEVLPPTEPGGTTIQPKISDSPEDTNLDVFEGRQPGVLEPAKEPEIEKPITPENTSEPVFPVADQPVKDAGPQDAIGTFSHPDAGHGTVTEAERDAAMGDSNSVGNIISGAIAAHEIIPEIMPGQREEEEAPSAGITESIQTTGTFSTDYPTVSDTQPEEASKFEETPEEELNDTDYASMNISDLEAQLLAILKQSDNRKNYRQVNAMYREYELKLAAEKNEAQERFINEGGSADDFQFRLTPERQNVEKAMQAFRENRVRDQRSEEEQKVKNLERKKQLIEELRGVVEAAETKASTEKMKAIQEEWKAIGPVPQNESQQLWNSYHALLDIFYNNRSIYFELKELDRKRNLNAKQQLVERAEALADNPSINASLQELRHLHEEWKNIGPVPNDQRDAIWDRFIQASEKIHERKKEFLAGRRETETANLTKKTEVLQRMESFQDFNTDRINDWRDKTDEIQKVKEEWDAIGLVPKENADQINKRFWGIYKAFFHNKNQFFKALDEQKMQNLKLKTELCEQAEAIKDSNDWDTTKEQLIQLQKKWKTIGRVPDKYSDKIWERFRAACNEFFDRKQNESQQKEAEQEKLSSEKSNYLEELTGQMDQHVHPIIGSLTHFQEMLAKWRSFETGGGRANAQLEERFYTLMEKYLDTVPDITNEEKCDLLFKLQLNKLKSGPDSSAKLQQREQGLRREISQLENDIRTLKTNIEFFAKSKNAEKLREEYEARTQDAYQRIEMLQKQLKELRS